MSNANVVIAQSRESQTAAAILPPADRRTAHNVALRHLIHVGDMLARRVTQERQGENFQDEGLALAWAYALQNLRSYEP